MDVIKKDTVFNKSIKIVIPITDNMLLGLNTYTTPIKIMYNKKL